MKGPKMVLCAFLLGIFLHTAVAGPGPTPVMAEPDSANESTQAAVTSPSQQRGEPAISRVRRDEETASSEPINYARLEVFAALGMLVVAFAQMVMFVWQLKLMRTEIRDSSVSARAAQAAADSANMSAMTAVAVEMPMLQAAVFGLGDHASPFNPHDPPGGSVNDGFPKGFASAGPVEFANAGRTAAVLDRIEFGWAVCDKLPAVPCFREVFQLPPNTILKPNESYQIGYIPCIALSDNEKELIKAGHHWLWFYGSLHFKDFLSDAHESRFCVRFEKRPRGWLNPFAFFSDGDAPAAYTESIVRRTSMLRSVDPSTPQG